MTAARFEIETPPGEPIVVVRRFFAAPPALVFEAFTSPEHARHWLGPRSLDLPVSEADVRPGGWYRFVHRAPDGQEFRFHGEYREVDPPRRLVRTFVYEGMPEDEAVETTTFEDASGGTLLISTSVHASVAARDQHVANGMARGITESFERLDDWLARQPASAAP